MVIRANVEGSEILYRAAFSSEKQCYKVSIDGSEIDFRNEYTLTGLRKLFLNQGRTEGGYIISGYKVLVPDDSLALSSAIHNIDIWLKRCHSLADCMTVYIGSLDRSNFRYEAAKTPRLVAGREIHGYKSGRQQKPLLYTELRNYLLEQWKAEIVTGIEEDDALGIHRGLMCHIDKDINMVPGEHYHWVNDVRYTVEEGITPVRWEDGKLKAYGKMFFYVQLLLGDSTDNIPGLVNLESNKQTNYGPKSIYDLLKNYNKEEEILAKVKELYYNAYKSEWKTRLYEIADLVWIVQTPGVTGSVYLENSNIL